MNELARLALRRNAIGIATAADVRRGQAQHSLGEYIAAPEIVEQPAVDTELAERGLNRGDVDHGAPGLPESAFAPAMFTPAVSAAAANAGKRECLPRVLL